MTRAEARKVYLLASVGLLTRKATKAIPERRKIPDTPTPTTPENKLLQKCQVARIKLLTATKVMPISFPVTLSTIACETTNLTN